MPSPFDLHCAGFSARGTSSASRPLRWRGCGGIPLLAPVLFSLFCTSCGAVGSGPPPVVPASVTVTVTPSSAQPFTGGSVQFSAQVQNATGSVNWMVNQIPKGNSTVGTIDASGKYIAPSQVPASGAIVTVTAVLQAEPSVSGSASVTIQSPSSTQAQLILSPALASVTTSQPLQLNVQTGISNSDVSWAVACEPAGACVSGTISQTGLFTPPNTASSNIVTASLLANPSTTGTATVEVTDFAGTLTWRNDPARSGINNRELALAPSTVNPSTFGWLFRCPIDGAAYAQPLYVPNLAIPGNGTHNVVIVATEMDSVYAFDADAAPCQVLWHASVVPSGLQPISSFGLNIVPFIGITGTPVIDTGASQLYVVAALQTNQLNPSFLHQLYALDLSTGTTLPPAGFTAFPPNASFSSAGQLQRAALLLDNGTVYVAFGGNGSTNTYHGWLFAYDAASLAQTGVFDVTMPPASQGGIWMSGGGPSADSNHNVFVVTGDGPFNAYLTNPTPNALSYGDSFLRLILSQELSVADYFTPCDQANLQTAGLDVGASAPVLLPESAGSASQPNLLIGGSKDGTLYVVNRDSMGGFLIGPCPGVDSPPRVQTVLTGGAILSTPLYWNGGVYVAPGNGSLSAYAMSEGTLSPFPSVTQTTETLGPQGATPVLSANATSNAILWLIDTSGALATPNGPAILRAYDPNNNLNEIYNSAMAAASRDQAGLAVKFTVPTVANGKAYVGTQTELDVYGLLP
jgi:hypothetical protein